MTTILNAFDFKDGCSTVSTNKTYPFLSYSPNSLEYSLCKNTFHLDSMYNGSVQSSSPSSFKLFAKDVLYPPRSSEFSSILNDKSNSRDYSDTSVLANLVLSDQIDTDQSRNSTNSMSPISQQSISMTGEKHSSKYATRGSLLFNKNNHNRNVQPNQCDSNCLIFPICDSTSSMSPPCLYNYSTHGPNPINQMHTYSANRSVDMYHKSQFRCGLVSPLVQNAYVHRQSNNMNRIDDSTYLRLPNSLICLPSFNNRSEKTGSIDYSSNSCLTKQVPSSFPTTYSNGKNNFNQFGRVVSSSYHPYSMNNCHWTPMTNQSNFQRLGYPTGQYDQFYLNRSNELNIFSTYSKSTPSVHYFTSVHSHSYIANSSNNRTTGLNLDCQVANSYHKTTKTFPTSMSFIEKPNLDFVNTKSVFGGSKRDRCSDINSELISPNSKLKRKGSHKVSNRIGKYRRMSNELPISTKSDFIDPIPSFISNLIRTSDVKRFIENPIVKPDLDLYSPRPCFDFSKPTNDLDCINNNLDVCARKYFSYPFTLHNSKPRLVNDQFIWKNLSQSIDFDKYNKFICSNFLINSYKNALIRNSSLSYYSPKSPQTSNHCSLIEFDKEGRSDCVTPPLKFRLMNYLKSQTNDDELNNLIVCKTLKNYNEKIVSVQQLMSHNLTNLICTNCAMHILHPNKCFPQSKTNDKSSLVMMMKGTFCSQTCFLDYQKRLNINQDDTSFHSIVSRFVEGTSLSTASVVILKKPCFTKIKQSTKRQDLWKIRKKQTNESNQIIRSKWRNVRWQKWNNHSFGYHRLVKQSQNEMVLHKFSLFSSNSSLSSAALDNRLCDLCHHQGDGPSDVSGRLINLDVNRWLHLNCILWCYETYETISGSLVDVDRSLEKAMKTSCSECHKLGAGLPCFDSDCQFIYHLPCASQIGCSFYLDRSMYCPLHKPSSKEMIQLSNLIVDRKVYITRDEDAQVANIIANEDFQTKYPSKLRIGTLILHRLGQLLPDQLESGLFHNSNYIYPVGFWSSRIYWSFRNIGQRCRYDCRIEDHYPVADANPKNDLHLRSTSVQFVVEVIESTGDSMIFHDVTCNGVWQQILKKINELRHTSSFIRIFENNIQGETLFGLDEPHIIRAVESLPAVNQLSNYVFKFGKFKLIKKMPLVLNPSGCARSEPKKRLCISRKPVGEKHGFHGLFDVQNNETSGLSNSFELGSPTYLNPQSPSTSSKYQHYRRLRYEWKANVLLARSRIQGLGLFASRDISKHTFIIEYLGEMIRNEVGNRRERLYESQNRGIYMFRVDDDWIVDATMSGGLARYINHSCDPNCSAEILNCDNGSHIVIIACKSIEKGDELTYDYKFDLEEDRWDRIPCMCGSANCRKWMN